MKDPTGGPLDGLPTIRPCDGIQAGKRIEVIFLQQVKEIYGRENGWKTFGQYQPVPAIYLKNKFRDDSTHHLGFQIHPQQQVVEARKLTSCLTQRLLSESPP